MVDFTLKGQVTIVTGASKGIGRAIARAFSEAGTCVTVSSRKLEDVTRVAQETEMAGGQAHMGYPDQAKSLVDQTLQKGGRLDIAVNNAATNPHFGPMLTADAGQIEKTLDVNLKGYIRLCQQVVPHMQGQGGGRIIGVASVAGLRADSFMGVYSISKAGIFTLTQILAREPGEYHIRGNAIARILSGRSSAVSCGKVRL